MTISGAGFAAGIADLEISINSVPTRLAAVATDQVGAFAALHSDDGRAAWFVRMGRKSLGV